MHPFTCLLSSCKNGTFAKVIKKPRPGANIGLGYYAAVCLVISYTVYTTL